MLGYLGAKFSSQNSRIIRSKLRSCGSNKFRSACSHFAVSSQIRSFEPRASRLGFAVSRGRCCCRCRCYRTFRDRKHQAFELGTAACILHSFQWKCSKRAKHRNLIQNGRRTTKTLTGHESPSCATRTYSRLVWVEQHTVAPRSLDDCPNFMQLACE